MNYLSANGLFKSYGIKVLFDDLYLGVDKGQKIALVGRNGCGKSTLLRILARQEAPDTGEVSVRNGIKTVYLSQNPDFGTAVTVMDALFTGDDPTIRAIKDYERHAAHPQADPAKLQRAIDKMEEVGAWDYEARVKEILGKLGIHDLEMPLSSLSGGQHKRVALGQALVSEPDLLLLDEPTNHLDTATIEWLEGYLAAKAMSLVLVTHDRYFLDRVCNEVVELDHGKAHRYIGDYEHFLEKKAERHAAEDALQARAQNLLRTELEWLRRQPKARTTKSKARIDAAHDLMETAKGPARDGDISMNFAARRLGNKILELEHVRKSYGDKCLVRDFSYVFKRGERIGIVGPNGVGKTTFLNLITQRIGPDGGKVEQGETIQFGYYSQEGIQIKEGQKIIDVITEAAEEITLGSGDKLKASAALILFGFPPAMQQQQASLLSGGERRRLYLLRVLMAQPNFLILDEPTNDLDLITLNTLEQFLLSYNGCLMIVSHDRYFLDKLCDHLFIFEGNGEIKPFPGTFREYRERLAAEEAQARAEKPSSSPSPAPAAKTAVKEEQKKLSYKEQREYESLEGEIAELEEKKSEIDAKINAGSGDYRELQAWAEESERLGAEISTKSDRWLELAERA
ncbi:MAG: ABC-F family ATP-binding cassette domain-containing protein [Bacteroidia bacterium]